MAAPVRSPLPLLMSEALWNALACEHSSTSELWYIRTLQTPQSTINWQELAISTEHSNPHMQSQQQEQGPVPQRGHHVLCCYLLS